MLGKADAARRESAGRDAGRHALGNAARRPSAEDMRKLEEAASQPGRKGEVVLRVLDIVGANGPFDLPADVTIECVRSPAAGRTE